MVTFACFRRLSPRVQLNAFCTEYIGNAKQHSTVVDLSEGGLRVHRPDRFRGRRRLQLEFELPDIDEVIWAEGEVCFDEVVSTSTTSPWVCASGIRILSTADYHRRLLRNYVSYLRNEAGLAQDTSWYSYLPGISTPRRLT